MRPPRHIAGAGQQVTYHVDADLVRESARIARDKTLLEVRDLVDRIKVTEPNPDRYAYSDKARTAEQFRNDLRAELRRLSEGSDQ